LWYRSVDHIEFDMKPFTVLFGRNNSGKTKILEAIYGVLSPYELNAESADQTLPRGLRGASWPEIGAWPRMGALRVRLEAGAPFDDDVLILRNSHSAKPDGSAASLPASEAAFISIVDGDYDGVGLTFYEARDFIREVNNESYLRPDRPEPVPPPLVDAGPRPLPLFLDLDIDNIETRVGNALMESLSPTTEVRPMESGQELRIRQDVQDRLALFAEWANELLPDFLDGTILATLQLPPTGEDRPSVVLRYCDPLGARDGGLPGAGPDVFEIAELGRGSSRWVAVAMQIALHLLVHGGYPERAQNHQEKSFSGHVLFLDEPEAHLHPLAVKSVVRWCQQMVQRGFNVIVASHHEEFLRYSSPDVAHVHITHGGDPPVTRARTLLASVTPLLQDLAHEVGMHPATVLSLNRCILFVEGPLDHAVLDEYAAADLDHAGVLIVPMHGTRNLEGLIDAELAPRLGIKAGVLTDATDPDTMGQRSNSKRSREETWVTRLITSFADRDLAPPTPFGIPEDDLLFALPAEGIRKCYPESASNFPGWRQMLEQCRADLLKGPSDSVDWKLYAEQHYGLPLTTAHGVRSLVHTLDLNDVAFPSIRRVIDQIVAWAAE
jgi:energy-coupling factor transporter ATP-binding protein EcfA2